MLNYGYYNVAAATIDVQIGDVEANTEAILKPARIPRAVHQRLHLR